MPTTNLAQADSQLLEQTTRHSVMLERLKAGEVKKFEKYLRQIDKLVREQLTRKELTTYSRDRLEQFLARVDGKLLEIYKAYADLVQADLVDIALYESSFEAKGLSNALSIDAVVRGKLFRDGGLTPEKFAKLQLDKSFKPLTLAQLKGAEPDMFT